MKNFFEHAGTFEKKKFLKHKVYAFLTCMQTNKGKIMGIEQVNHASGSVQQQPAQATGAAGISKHAEKLWNSLSKDLRKNPEANLESALANCLSLSKSLVGKEIHPELLNDILASFDMLEKTLSGLKIGPKEKHGEITSKIQNDLLKCRLDVLATPKQVEELKTKIQQHSAEQ